MVDWKSLVKGIKGIGQIGDELLSVVSRFILGALVVGAIAYVAADGSISIEGNWSGVITNLTQTGATFIKTNFGKILIGLGLIGLVFIITVLGMKFGGKGKKSML